MQQLPFEGVKVLDFCWVAAGPVLTRYLADFGATVIRVESALRPDVLRMGQPFKDGVSGINRSGYYANYNSNKLSLALNMGHPKALEIVKALVPQMDIVSESFTPGTMERWGLGYEDLQKLRPDLIYYAASMFGRGGPFSGQPGFGGYLTPFTGFAHITGWPDRPPAGPYGPYTDFLVPRFGFVALVGALEHRMRTGQGMRLDMSQLEAALHFLAPVVLDYTVNGREMERKGNRSDYAAPHGTFPCREHPPGPDHPGDEAWIAIACFDDAEWQALRLAMGEPAWAQDACFSTLRSRKEHEDELEEGIASWTQSREAPELMRTLQAAGVPAGVVNSTADLFADPQLRARGHWVQMEHPEIGVHSFDAAEIQLSETPATYRSPSPLLGQHTEHVLTELLGMTTREVAALSEEGVLQ